MQRAHRLCRSEIGVRRAVATTKPRHDRVVLMADQYGKLSYVDDGGLVDVREVVNTHCERKERERAQW